MLFWKAYHRFDFGPGVLCKQGLKKCKFPGKLFKISHRPQFEDEHLFMTL